jgi:hypothetical protein
MDTPRQAVTGDYCSLTGMVTGRRMDPLASAGLERLLTKMEAKGWVKHA